MKNFKEIKMAHLETIDKMPRMDIIYPEGVTTSKNDPDHQYWLNKICNYDLTDDEKNN